MKYLTRFYVGLQDKDNKLSHSVDELVAILNKTYLAYTLIKARGCYTYDNGDYTNEDTYIVEIFHEGSIALAETIDEIKQKLNQECVLVYTQNVQAYCV